VSSPPTWVELTKETEDSNIVEDLQLGSLSFENPGVAVDSPDDSNDKLVLPQLPPRKHDHSTLWSSINTSHPASTTSKTGSEPGRQKGAIFITPPEIYRVHLQSIPSPSLVHSPSTWTPQGLHKEDY